jgi:hypothetical protein
MLMTVKILLPVVVIVNPADLKSLLALPEILEIPLILEVPGIAEEGPDKENVDRLKKIVEMK